METNLGNPERPRQIYLFNSKCLLVRLQKQYSFFPLLHCKVLRVHTHEQSQREQGIQLQKNIKPEDNLSVLLRRAQASKPKHRKRRKYQRTKQKKVEV